MYGDSFEIPNHLGLISTIEDSLLTNFHFDAGTNIFIPLMKGIQIRCVVEDWPQRLGKFFRKNKIAPDDICENLINAHYFEINMDDRIEILYLLVHSQLDFNKKLRKLFRFKSQQKASEFENVRKPKY